MQGFANTTMCEAPVSEQRSCEANFRFVNVEWEASGNASGTHLDAGAAMGRGARNHTRARTRVGGAGGVRERSSYTHHNKQTHE